MLKSARFWTLGLCGGHSGSPGFQVECKISLIPKSCWGLHAPARSYLENSKSCFIWPNNGWGQNQWMLPLEKGLGHRDGTSTTPLCKCGCVTKVVLFQISRVILWRLFSERFFSQAPWAWDGVLFRGLKSKGLPFRGHLSQPELFSSTDECKEAGSWPFPRKCRNCVGKNNHWPHYQLRSLRI